MVCKMHTVKQKFKINHKEITHHEITFSLDSGCTTRTQKMTYASNSTETSLITPQLVQLVCCSVVKTCSEI